MADFIDKCGLKLLILLAWWILLSQIGVALAPKVLASFSAAMCTVGAIGIKPAPATERKPKEKFGTKLKAVFKAALTRQNARRFAITALILLVFSFFVGYPVLFYVGAVVNIALTVACFAARDV